MRSSKMPQLKKKQQDQSESAPPPPQKRERTRRNRRYGPGNRTKSGKKMAGLIFTHASFARLATEISCKYFPGVKYTWDNEAILHLRQAAQSFLVALFEAAYSLTQIAGRVTLTVEDLNVAQIITGIKDRPK